MMYYYDVQEVGSLLGTVRTHNTPYHLTRL
jgi:hypothetical protein